ncbi:hypothetical protein SteCoe_35105 [Stentor coeruleus]|uniref:Tyrosine-protein kinase ephrin type A/B receptor-like domain-containing protein n=1 Tax=Stentor coeruleus TaxID=5963 RepID=A0A1R2AT60_9CILI|nr:hypothetical protein SteCoe_35105 [Stentor coeruleus]
MAFLLTLFLCITKVFAEEALISIDLFKNGVSPEPRTNPSISVDPIGKNLYLFGGRSKSHYLNDLWSFDLENLVWNLIYAISQSPEPRSNSKSFFRSRTQEFCIYLGNSDESIFFDFWCFSTILRIWQKNTYSYIEFSPFIKVQYLENNEKEYLIILSVDNLSATIAYIFDMLNEETKIISLSDLEISRKNEKSYFLEIVRKKIIVGHLENYESGYYAKFYSCDIETTLCEIQNYNIPFYEKLDSIVEITIIDDSMFLLTSSAYIISFSIFTSTSTLNHFEKLPIHFGHTSNKNSIYIFGGIENKSLTNALTQIFINSPQNISSTILSKNQIIPPLRLKSGLLSVRDKLYLYGGLGKNHYLDDLWTFSPSLSKWSQIFNQNNPSPRHSFAYKSIGDIIVIFGGQTESGYNNDLFIYNVVTNIWTEMTSKSIIKPSKRYGACLVLDLPFIYIGGGANESGICNDVWVYDIIKEEYKKTKFEVDSIYAYCFKDNENIRFRYGENPTDPESEIIGKSLSGQMDWGWIVQIFKDDELVVGGVTRPGFLRQKFLYYYNKIQIIADASDLTCYSMHAYHGSSIYYFSGSYFASRSKIFYSLPRAKFAKFDLNLLCNDFNCTFECSPGFVLYKSSCVICPPGTYSYNNICLPCKKGYYNPLPGASSIMQCYPCPEASFNNKEGCRKCKVCPIGYLCYAGSIIPESQNRNSQIIKQSLSSIKVENKLQYSDYNEIFIGFCIVTIFFLGFFINDKTKILIIKIDLFQNFHNYKVGEKVYLQKNFLGATFTLLLYITFIYIGSIMIISYFTENKYKEHSLFPLVLLSNDFENLKADFEVYVEIKNYFDQCITFDIANSIEKFIFTTCASNILISTSNFQRQKLLIKCMMLENHSCLIKLFFSDCKIDKITYINLDFNGNLSYSSGLYVNLTSFSYVSNSIQSSFSEIYPRKNCVLTGKNPNIFKFILSPSLLESSMNSKSLVGYNSKEVLMPIKGSEKSVEDLYLPSQMHIEIVLEKDSHGLLTKVNRILNLRSLLGALFGTFTGLMTIFCFFMRITENYCLFRLPPSKIVTRKNIFQQRLHISYAFKDFYFNVISNENIRHDSMPSSAETEKL